MPAAEFWDGDPWLAAGYREADRISRQRKSEELYLAGYYNFTAFATVAGNILRKKGTAPHKYMEEPIRVVPYTEQEKAAIAIREREKTIEFFNRLAAKWEKKA